MDIDDEQHTADHAQDRTDHPDGRTADDESAQDRSSSAPSSNAQAAAFTMREAEAEEHAKLGELMAAAYAALPEFPGVDEHPT